MAEVRPLVAHHAKRRQQLLLVPSSSHHPARTRLRFFPQALIAGFGYPLHDVPPQRVQLLTQPVFEVAIVGPTLEHVDHDLEELQVSLT